MEIELKKEDIKYETEKETRIQYEGKNIGSLRLDFVVDDKVILELKAVERLAKIFREQLISQLKAAPYEVGLLVNFGSPKLEYIRVVRRKPV